MKVPHATQCRTPCLECCRTQRIKAHLPPTPAHIYTLWRIQNSPHSRKSGSLSLFGNPNGGQNQPGPRSSTSSWSMHKAVAGMQLTLSFQCADHIEEGRQLLWLLRSVTHKGFRGVGCKVLDLYEQVFDLLTSLLTEIRFFEVKLDEYAPVFPLSRISEAHYYFTV